MSFFSARKALAAVGLVAGLAVGAGSAAAQQTAIKFSLDWKFEGPAAAFLIAQDRGYFAEEGLDVTIDSGNGSAGAVTRVASGAYDVALADLNSMVEFNAANPDRAMKSLFIVYDRPPFAIFSLKKNNLTEPAHLEGKTLGAPVFDSPRKLFPAFVEATGIDASGIEWQSMDPPLREPMLVRGDVDAISGFYFTSLLNLRAQGVSEDDLNVIRYADHGLDFYGNGLIASPDLMESNPEALRGFLRAVVKGWRDVIADPDAGVAAVKKRDPLITEALERDRLMMVLNNNVLTDAVLEDGMGAIRAERMGRAIDQLVTAFNIANPPVVEDVFTDAFLPAKEDRMLK